MIKIKKNNQKKVLTTLGISILSLTTTLGICFYNNHLNLNIPQKNITDVETIAYYSAEKIGSTSNFKQSYLSDMTPIKKAIGYKHLGIDADTDGNPIVLNVENNLFTFKKGLYAHANSELIYDLDEYSDYSYFVAFIGLNNTSNRGDGVTYHFYTSDDNKTWEEYGEGIHKNPKEIATFVSIPLNNHRYLRLVVDALQGNGADHSVFADAKLVNELGGNFALESVEDLDKKINSKYNGSSNIDSELEHLILKRELVKRVGQYTLNSFYNENEDNQATIDWLLNDKQVLKYYVLGGTPAGNSYYNSLTQLARLYKAYKEDFKIPDTTKYGTVLGDLYTRMAISLSLTHSQLVGLWMQSSVKENQSDALVRYQQFKDLHKNNKFKINDKVDVTEWFEKYNVENMRFVMNANIDDESVIWLNEYVQYKIDTEPNKAWITPHPHMAYVWPNYSNPIFYDEENREYFNELFSVNGKTLDDYGITRGTNERKIYKQWMNFRNKFGTGAVCGGISKSGAVIRATHGIAATVIGQPGHAALLYYGQDSQGRGYWNIDNDVSGWTLSEKGERMLLGWGNASYAKGSYQVVYMTLAQEVLNDYANFEKAEELIMLAKSYSSNEAKQEQLLREALKTQSINIDAWYDLIQLYNNSNTKTEEDYYNLAEELAESLKYFPLPMYHLTNLIKPKLTSIENIYKFTLLQTRILNQAKSTPNNTADSYTVYQPGVTRLEANFLLGKVDSSIATFSFDGANAGKIVLSSKFDGNGIRWDYSLDGKQTWKEVSFTGEEEHKLTLTPEEINSITSENDIYVHIVGVNYEEKNLFKIDITDGSLISDMFANDLENRIVGVNLLTEWRYSENDSWTSYSVSSPDLTGNKSVQVRQAATGTSLASNASEMFTFTEDNQPNTRKYIPVSHLSIESVSTEATSNGGAAIKAIDANYNTRWHSAWNGSDTQRFIVIKLDKPVNLSAVEFVPAGGGNGKIYDGTVYGSMDGETWEELSSLKNLKYTNQANTITDAIINTKSFEIPDAKEVQYVKIVADRTNGNWFTARAFNFYQDISKNPHPTAGIAYSTTEKTNGKVVARLINPSTKITITNNDGSDTYTFTENGKFTFEFKDENGITGTAVATVDWIDKDIPDANVEYELDSNHKISISLKDITEDVYLLDKNNNAINYIEVENKIVKNISYLDSNENIYKTVDVDKNGCITKITYINTSGKVPSVSTYITNVTNGVITSEEYHDTHGNEVSVTSEEKEILKGLQQSITDPLEYTFEQSGDYEFKMLDKAKNIAYKSIKVDYNNDKTIIASDISYDVTHLTNKTVNATINPYVFNAKGEKQEAKLITGSSTHTFEKNGKYTFKYAEKKDTDDDDIKEHTAEVNWIDTTKPTALVQYTTQENGHVVATLVNESEEIIITNNSARRDYTFTENGEFTFRFEDMAGNTGSVLAKVDSIEDKTEKPKPTEPVTPENPSTPGNPTSPENPLPDNNTNTNTVIPYKPTKPNNSNVSTNNNSTTNNNDSSSNEPDNNTSNNVTDNDTSDKTNNQKPSTNTTTQNKDDKKPEEVKEKKTSKGIYFILAAIIVILGVILTGIIMSRKEN